MVQKQNILIINGHPVRDSFNTALVNSYYSAAKMAGANVEKITVSDLQFDPNLKYGYTKRMELEPDLIDAQEKIKWATHLVWVHPLWWGGVPALLKGFLDRVFLPGFAFKSRPNSLWWDKLLKGRSARIITTMDQPYWWYWLINGRPGIYQLKKNTLEYCGISPVKVTSIGPIKHSKTSYREQWIKKVEVLAKKDSLIR